MKGKREFPSDISASGDVLSHLSEFEMLQFLPLLNIGKFNRLNPLFTSI